MKFIKPQFWDNKRPNLTSHLLSPLTIFTKISNYIIINSKKFKSKKIKSICIGNIYVGGTGKTPLAIKLFRLLNKINNKTVVAKKFYSSHKDEIKLLRKYTTLLVGKQRLEILKKAINKKFKTIIFDDGLQDKTIDYDLKFVCFDSSIWIGNGKLLPSGPLRQSLKILKKFDAVFLKNIHQTNPKILKQIKSINPKIQIFNFKIKIINKNQYDLSKKYLIMSGIGNSNNFQNLLKKNSFKILKHLRFPDHYEYSNIELKKIIYQAKFLKSKILTTEKDYIKIPKKYTNHFKSVKIDLHIDNQKKLKKFLKKKINE